MVMHATNGTLNQVVLIGHCAAAPDKRLTPQGTVISNFALYTNYIRRDEQGIAIEERERHQIAAWGRLGEAAHANIRKGSRVRVEGRLETRQWQDRESSQTRYRTQVVATNIIFLDPPPAMLALAPQEDTGISDDLIDHLAERDRILLEPPASVYEETPAPV
jgi:single stranded DNA-binding protein